MAPNVTLARKINKKEENVMLQKIQRLGGTMLMPIYYIRILRISGRDQLQSLKPNLVGNIATEDFTRYNFWFVSRTRWMDNLKTNTSSIRSWIPIDLTKKSKWSVQHLEAFLIYMVSTISSMVS